MKPDNKELLKLFGILVVVVAVIIFFVVWVTMPELRTTPEEQEFCKEHGYDVAENASVGNSIDCAKYGELKENRFGRKTQSFKKVYSCVINYNPTDINNSHFREPRCLLK